MKFIIPVYVTQGPGADGVYRARPLFFEEPWVKGSRLERVLGRLTSALRKSLSHRAKEERLEQLAGLAFCPNLYEKSFALRFHHKKRTIEGRFLVVVLPDHWPRVAFCPQLPDVWFQLHRGEDLKQRAFEVLDRYLASTGSRFDMGNLEHKAWTTDVELNFRVPATPPVLKEDPLKMILGGPPVQEGWQELERVGRSLDDDYPHDLVKCLCRDREVARVERALEGKARAPQLVVGPRKVGKTALVHQLVRHYRERRSNLQRRFWLLSPQRLISGMSYVGQWESRLLAILKHVIEKDLVLYFDDLLGLFAAGQSRDSKLAVSDVLKPYLQRGELRVVAEATPASLAVLRERDRGFADLFTITTLAETPEKETMVVLLEEMRESEVVHRCQFELGAITSILDLQRRYVRDAAFPGKSASFLRKVAARGRGKAISRDEVLSYFHSTSGMALELIDDQVTLSKAAVSKSLGAQVMGQPKAVEAATEAVMLAKARLADPSRPIASLLFVGPTGVGKTECAKALAKFLFGDAQRLLRFDMNEYVTPSAAARLVGTFHQPDGLLTAAVRRRPFCVILLDEIEKAHFEVFNLLLGLLGDGRLTDARGRTVDFTQTIVIMTSNLGVSEASRPIGLRSREGQENLIYRKAVEDFFPPEFFNRLDKVVPFSRLSREDTEVIARGLIDKVLAREGLVRRQCILDVNEEAMQEIVNLGYHPQLGARALKRAIESAISAPVSARLSEMPPHAPTVIGVRAKDGLQVNVRELRAAPARQGDLPWAQPAEFLAGISVQLDQAEGRLVSPEGMVGEEMTQEQLLYFSTSDRIRRARAILRRLESYQSSKGAPRRSDQKSMPLLQAQGWRSLLTSSDLDTGMKDLFESLSGRTADIRLQSKLAELMAEVALLDAPGQIEETTLRLSWGSAGRAHGAWLTTAYEELFQALDYEVKVELTQDGCAAELQLRGPDCGTLHLAEVGFHLFRPKEGLALVEVLPTEPSEKASVVRVYDQKYGVIDLRSGWMVQQMPDEWAMRRLVLTGLGH